MQLQDSRKFRDNLAKKQTIMNKQTQRIHLRIIRQREQEIAQQKKREKQIQQKVYKGERLKKKKMFLVRPDDIFHFESNGIISCISPDTKANFHSQ